MLVLEDFLDHSTSSLGPFSSNATRKLDVAGEDGDSFGVDSAQVGVLEAVLSSCTSARNALSAWQARLRVVTPTCVRARKGQAGGVESSQGDQIGLSSLLHRLEGTRLKSEILKGRRHVLGYFSDEPLKLPLQSALH